MAKATPATTNTAPRSPQGFYFLVFLLWDAYLFLTLQSPITASNSLGLSDGTITFLRLTIAVPYLVIWIAAAFAVVKIRKYAVAIKGSKEAPAFHAFALGIFILLVGLVASAFLSTARNLVGADSTWRPALTILINYSYVFPYLGAFWLMLQGSRRLADQTNATALSKNLIFYVLVLIGLAYLWLNLIFTNSTRAVSQGDSPATYYLADSLIVLSIVIPSLLTWFWGLKIGDQLRQYYHLVKGIIYRASLRRFVRGVQLVVLASVILQGIMALGAERLFQLGLGKLLGIIYLFILAQGLGFFLIARGAKRLAKIEEA